MGQRLASAEKASSKQSSHGNKSWHDLVEECAAAKGSVFAIRGDTGDQKQAQKEQRGEERKKMSWGRSRMGGNFAVACQQGVLKTADRDSFFFVEFSGRDFALGIVNARGPRGQQFSELISWHLPLLLLKSPRF